MRKGGTSWSLTALIDILNLLKLKTVQSYEEKS